jgi:hypothetical protein
MTRYHFFISRAGEDSNWAKWISNTLEAAGHTTTLQDFDFKPGQSIPHQIKLALDRADRVIAVLSAPYLSKDFTLTELYSVLSANPIGKQRLLIPVRVAPCALPRLINQFIFVDFVNHDEPTCRQLLLAAINSARIAEPVAFPGPWPLAPSFSSAHSPPLTPTSSAATPNSPGSNNPGPTRKPTSSRSSLPAAQARRPS